MRVISALLVLMAWCSLLYAQEAPDKVKEAVLKTVNEFHKNRLSDSKFEYANVLKSGEGNPSQDLVASYNPRKLYCVTCKVHSVFTDTVPSLHQKGEKCVTNENVMAVITQSGEIEIIWPISSLEMRKRLPMKEWERLWKNNCPYPMEGKSWY